jgi:hypothetical protein
MMDVSIAQIGGVVERGILPIRPSRCSLPSMVDSSTPARIKSAPLAQMTLPGLHDAIKAVLDAADAVIGLDARGDVA